MLVFKGYHQIKGIDHKQTFAPVIRIITLEFLLVLTASINLVVQQINVIMAFLKGKLECIICIVKVSLSGEWKITNVFWEYLFMD